MRRNVITREGFTLIEIMVVVVILGILATMIMPKIMGRPDEARHVKCTLDIKAIETGLNLYKIDNGLYPSTEQGLTALILKPATGQIPRKWRDEGYLPKIPDDPWGGEYLYLSPGAHGDYDLYSLGADGEEGGDGKYADINSWEIN